MQKTNESELPMINSALIDKLIQSSQVLVIKKRIGKPSAHLTIEATRMIGVSNRAGQTNVDRKKHWMVVSTAIEN